MHTGHWELSSLYTSQLLFASPAPATILLTIHKTGSDPQASIMMHVNGAPITHSGFRQGELSRTFRLASVNTIHMVTDTNPFPASVAGEYEIDIL